MLLLASAWKPVISTIQCRQGLGYRDAKACDWTCGDLATYPVPQIWIKKHLPTWSMPSLWLEL